MDIEALAAARAIELGTELSITHIFLEGDLGMIVKALADEVFCLAYHAPLIQDAKIMSRSFSQLFYSHYKAIRLLILWIDSLLMCQIFLYR